MRNLERERKKKLRNILVIEMDYTLLLVSSSTSIQSWNFFFVCFMMLNSANFFFGQNRFKVCFWCFCFESELDKCWNWRIFAFFKCFLLWIWICKYSFFLEEEVIKLNDFKLSLNWIMCVCVCLVMTNSAIKNYYYFTNYNRLI